MLLNSRFIYWVHLYQNNQNYETEYLILQARVLEWVAISFSRGSSWPKDRSWVSCTASRFFTIWATWGAHVFQSLSCVRLFAIPWTAARQASLSFSISLSFHKLISIESVMPSNHLLLCRPLLLLPSIFPSIRVFSNQLTLRKSIGVTKSKVVAKVLELQLQHQSFWWILRVDFI